MSQRDTLERVVDSLAEAMLDDARWPGTSALIDAACGARGSVLTFGEETSADDIEIFFAKCYHNGEDRSEWLQEYFRHYHPLDEHLPRLRNLPDSKIVHIANLFSEEEMKTSLTYNEALPRFETQNGLNVRLDGPYGSRIVWGIADPIDARDWSSAQIDMVARIAPHLRQYVRVRTALAEAGGLGASGTELLDNMRAGVIHLDRQGLIVEMNESARELLRRNDGLFDEAGVLCAANQKDNSRLEDLLSRALPRYGEQGASGSMMVKRSSSMLSLALHVKPVSSREEYYRSRQVAALVLIIDPVNRVRIDPGLLQTLLGLTPTESEIAVLLAEGWTARQIAAQTGRGYSTVRSHLKHISAKLKVSRQFEVVQTVLALSSLPTPRH